MRLCDGCAQHGLHHLEHASSHLTKEHGGTLENPSRPYVCEPQTSRRRRVVGLLSVAPVALFVSLVLAFAAVASGQQTAGAKKRPGKVEFTGLQQRKDEEVVAASGLRIATTNIVTNQKADHQKLTVDLTIDLKPKPPAK